MASQDASSDPESRREVVDVRILRLSQLVEERTQLARQVFALSTMSSVISPLQPVEAINEDKFQSWIGTFPMNFEKLVSMEAFNWNVMRRPVPQPIRPIAQEHAVKSEPPPSALAPPPPSPLTRLSEYDSKAEPHEQDIFGPDYRVRIVWQEPENAKLNVRPDLASTYSATLPTPPSKLLPAEMQRQTSLKKVKKGDKKEAKDPKGSWTPMEFNRWQAILSHNPAYKMVRKSTKCLTSADWDIAIRELLLVKAFERVDEMKAKGEWSLRQPQRQKQPVIAKDHWAYLLDEMRWMHTDFREERKWHLALALELAEACVEWHQTPPDERKKLCAKFRAPCEEGNAEPIEKGVPQDEETDETDAKADESGDVNMEDPEDREGSNLEESRMEVDPPVSIVPQTQAPPMSEPQFTLKSEEVEHTVPDAVPENNVSEEQKKKETPLREGGTNAVLSQAQFPAIETNYKPVRRPIVKLNSSTLWVNSGELQPLVSKQPPATAKTDKEDLAVLKPNPSLPNETDLLALFPDLQPYAGLGHGPDPTGKKMDRRCDELGSAASKWVPISQFTVMRPIVLSALDPLDHFIDDKWMSFENGAVAIEEGKQIEASKKPEERGMALSDLFVPEGKPNKEKKTLPISPLKKVLHRPLHWTAEDDTLLKKLVDENLSNWRLIAEAFNTLRKTVDIEQRTAETCRERYEMLVPPKEAKVEDDGSETDMDAKDGGLGRIQPDVLRPLNVVESAGDAPKVIRHQLVHRTIKRVALRRSEMLKEKLESAQRTGMVPHQSHEAYTKLKYMSPLELSRRRREQEEQKQQQELRRKQAELHRYHQLRALQHGAPMPHPGMGMPGIPGQPVLGPSGQPMNGPSSMRLGNQQVPNISQQGNPAAAMAAAMQRNALAAASTGGDQGMNHATFAMLQQQHQQRAMAMAVQAQAQGGLLSGSPPRPGSSTSNVGMAAAVPTNGQPQNHPMGMLAQQMRMNPQGMTQEQLNLYRQQQMRAMQMLQQQQQQLQQQAQQQQQQQQQNAQGAPNLAGTAPPPVPPSAG